MNDKSWLSTTTIIWHCKYKILHNYFNHTDTFCSMFAISSPIFARSPETGKDNSMLGVSSFFDPMLPLTLKLPLFGFACPDDNNITKRNNKVKRCWRLVDSVVQIHRKSCYIITFVQTEHSNLINWLYDDDRCNILLCVVLYLALCLFLKHLKHLFTACFNRLSVRGRPPGAGRIVG